MYIVHFILILGTCTIGLQQLFSVSVCYHARSYITCLYVSSEVSQGLQCLSHVAFAENTSFKSSGMIFLQLLPFWFCDKLLMDKRSNDVSRSACLFFCLLPCQQAATYLIYISSEVSQFGYGIFIVIVVWLLLKCFIQQFWCDFLTTAVFLA